MDPKDLRQAFANNLRQRLRHAKGISQEDLAYEAGVNRTYLSKLEKGASYPGLEIIAKLATILECEPAELLRVPTASGLLVNYAAIVIGAPARLFAGFAWTPCMSIWRPFRVCPNVNRYIRSRSCGIALDPRNWWITLWITSPTLT